MGIMRIIQMGIMRIIQMGIMRIIQMGIMRIIEEWRLQAQDPPNRWRPTLGAWGEARAGPGRSLPREHSPAGPVRASRPDRAGRRERSRSGFCGRGSGVPGVVHFRKRMHSAPLRARTPRSPRTVPPAGPARPGPAIGPFPVARQRQERRRAASAAALRRAGLWLRPSGTVFEALPLC